MTGELRDKLTHRFGSELSIKKHPYSELLYVWEKKRVLSSKKQHIPIELISVVNTYKKLKLPLKGFKSYV